VAEFSGLLLRHLAGRVALDCDQVAALERHYQLLVRWNRVLNLTSIRNMEDAVVRHYCECLFFASLLPDGARILDLGSGAGFPGIPIAILHPQRTVSLVESHQRKAVFLREAVRERANVQVLAQRAEDVAGEWDLVVSRAVTPADVVKLSARLAPKVAMLVGDEGRMGFEAFKLPWGEGRWAIFGNVPRGT
jgi:16S rRNA (guanine527-N7)-methyltransferase